MSIFLLLSLSQRKYFGGKKHCIKKWLTSSLIHKSEKEEQLASHLSSTAIYGTLLGNVLFLDSNAQIEDAHGVQVRHCLTSDENIRIFCWALARSFALCSWCRRSDHKRWYHRCWELLLSNYKIDSRYSRCSNLFNLQSEPTERSHGCYVYTCHLLRTTDGWNRLACHFWWRMPFFHNCVSQHTPLTCSGGAEQQVTQSVEVVAL